MKHLLISILFVISLGTKAQTYIYHPFPQVNSYWDFSQSFYCWTGIPGYVTQSYSIFVSNDTLIGTETYHKLFIPYLKSDSSGCSSASVTQGIYKGCIREDSSAKKVYYIKPFLSTEKLLYDFNLQVGDTIYGELEAPGSAKDTVIAIDSVEAWGSGGGWVKRWFINSCYNIYIIEGVGSNYGLIETSPGCGPDNGERDLMCMVGFIPTGSYIYPAITDCDMITTTNSIEEKENIELFPNPSSGKFILNMDYVFLSKKSKIEVYNIVGELILEKQITSNEVDLSSFSKGVYFLKIYSEEKVYSEKVIIE